MLAFPISFPVTMPMRDDWSPPTPQMTALLALALITESRPFRMGFTPWPPEMSPAGIARTEQFMAQNGDVKALMFLGGIPWNEALNNQPFPPDLQRQLETRPPAGTRLFLSVSPLSMTRRDLAPNWGLTPNQPLPPEWRDLPFDDPKVIQAFTRFTIRTVEALKPDYLAIGVESNALLTYDKSKWPAYKRLHQQVYRSVKARFRTLPIFFTTEVNHLLGRSQGANAPEQLREVTDLMRSSDWFAMSYYPHMTFATPWPIPADTFAFAKQFRKPIAVTETGMSSQPVVFPQLTLPGSPEKQDQYYKVLLDTAHRDRYRLVITFCTTDFERLLPALPPADKELASIWTFTGLQTSTGQIKPAGTRWQQTFALPYRP